MSSKAEILTKQADNKLSNATGFICRALGQTASNKEDAAMLYTKAAAQYKLSKCYEQAAKAYKKAAEIQITTDLMFEAKQLWKECAKCYTHLDYKQAIAAYYNAIEIALESNKIREAARLQHEIAKMLFDHDDIEAAMTSYQKAAEFYEMEHNKHCKNKMLLMVVQMHASQQNWEIAAKLYEDISKHSADDKLLRWCVKDKLFNASLLRICSICNDDTINGSAKWNEIETIHEEYCDWSHIYSSGRGAKLIRNIIQCLKQNEMDEFHEILANYDKIFKFEKLHIDLLHEILRFMKNVEHDKIICGIWLGDNDDEDNDSIQMQTNPFQQSKLTEHDLKDAPDLEMDLE